MPTAEITAPPRFTCNLDDTVTPLPHFWEHTVGSGHATLALRADWQAQIARCRRELGFRYVRFHGILSDDMGTLMCESDELLYSFFNADQIFDYLISIGMKPFVELSFMPTTLSSGDKIVFHYRANVTSPNDYAKWGTLIRRLVSHWVDRYGIEEVSLWFFEVWNEPNLTAFGSGRQNDYFELYEHTATAIKSVDERLSVGGPATAANEWITDFTSFCVRNNVAADFISTHHYPTDAFGKPGDDTEAQLAASPRSVLRDQARGARREAGTRPLYYTEWSTSSNSRDPLHDEPYAAAFIVKTVMEANGLVDGYSYWTFSDIFEENYFPSIPFHGGFGLLTLHGIAKPAYRAFEVLHALGVELLGVTGSHETVDVWVVRKAGEVTVLMTNLALPRHAIATETVHIELTNAGSPARATVRRIDRDHGNARRRWDEIGRPEYLSAAQVADLDVASRLHCLPQPYSAAGGTVTLSATLAPQSVTAVSLIYDSSAAS